MAADRRMPDGPVSKQAAPASVDAAGFGVRLDRVSKAYGPQKVLKEISLDIAPGECLALLGPNGAGKTTLFKLLLGLVRPDGGALEVDSVQSTAPVFRSHRAAIGFLPENVSFHDAMTGQELLTFYARLKGVPAAQCPDLLERVGLADAASRRVATYSKGMRQRLGLAQALLGRPRLLVLDEPTTGLDAALRQTFFDILRNFKDAGVTIVISSHALTEIEARADRYAILQGGRMTAIGTLDALQQESGLPVRIRVQIPTGKLAALRKIIANRGTLSPQSDGRVEIACAPGDKVALIREILTSSIPVSDIEVRSSSLEDVYAHFSARGGQA